MSESWSFDLAAVGSAGAVGYQINPKLSLWVTHKCSPVHHKKASQGVKWIETPKTGIPPTLGASTAVYVAPGGTW